jgi:hypothetical protein
MKRWLRVLVFLALGVALIASERARSDGAANQPYIEKLKRKLEREAAEKGTVVAPRDGSNPDPYIQQLKRKMPAEQQVAPGGGESYIESLKRQHPERYETPGSGGGFIDQERGKIEPKDEGGAIAAVNEGRSELEFKRKGKIKGALGFRYGASLSRSISAVSGTQANSFDSVYGQNYSPDVSLFYEHQFFHSATFGSLGLLGSLGVGYFSGKGRFAIDLTGFSTESRTKFQFFFLPVTVGPSYRFNLARYLVPFATVGPAFIPYMESRNDSKKGFRGYSTGIYASGGVMIPLDWLSKSASSDLYYDQGVKRYSLTAEYSRLSTLSGDVTYDVSGVNIGLLFEY